MRGKIFGSILGLGLMLAGPAQLALGAAPAAAEEWHGRGGYGGYYGHDHDGIGAGGVLLGLAAVAGVAALASSASHHNGYYDRGYYAPPPPPAYGYAPGYYQGGYNDAAVGYCRNAAVGQARGWDGYARPGRVYSVERRGDDVWVRGSVVAGGGYGGYGREIAYQCKFDNGRVRSLRIERPGYAYGY